ncbi:MAG TPA: hypothetical protein VGN46_14025 [Luteibacter sp.]|uniref:hypothetical protein n=1 Tax=Luteibacter sp. TaxID=1886636 RepID=UPI002F3FC2E0
MANKADIPWASTAWGRVPWGMQNYIFFYLRSHHFPVTPHNTELLAQAIANRLQAGPVLHRDLEIVIDRSAVEYLLDDDADEP